MGNPAYVYQNLIEDAAALEASTEDASYPVTNIYNRIKADPFKFTVAGGYVEVDFGGLMDFDTFALIGHNATSLSGTVKGGSAPNPSQLLANLTYRSEDLWANVDSLSPLVSQYVRATFTSTDLTEIGEMVLGTRTVLPRAARWGIRKGLDDQGVTYRTSGGVTWDFENYSKPILQVSFRFPESEYAAYQLFSTRVQRNPFVWIPDVDAAPVFYVKKMRGILPDSVGPAMDGSALAVWYDWTVSMEVESSGLAVTA